MVPGEVQPPFRPAAAFGDGLDKRAGFPGDSLEQGCREWLTWVMLHPPHAIPAWAAQETAQTKPAQLALGRAEAPRDAQQEEPALL